MKVWYCKKLDIYLPRKDWYKEDEETYLDIAGPLKEIEVTKEEIIVEGGDNDPYMHGEVWELEFASKDWMHSMGTKIPWKQGKYKITIEEVK